MSMIYELTEQQQEIRDLARQIAVRDIKPVREALDEQEKFPWEVVKKMAAADLYSVYLPEAYGGMGGGLMEQVLVIEQLSRACGGIALAFAASGLGVLPILLLGTPEQRSRFIPDLASGKKLAAFSITEANAGSDATATECTAKLDGNDYILNGSKIFVSNGEVA